MSSSGSFHNPFGFLWAGNPPSSNDEAVAVARKIEEKVASAIFCNEPDPLSESTYHRLFMPYHENGTFMIGERHGAASASEQDGNVSSAADGSPFSHYRHIGILSPFSPRRHLAAPPFTRGEPGGFEEWARLTAYQDLLMMEYEGQLPDALTAAEMLSAANAVADALQYPLTAGRRICDLIPNQNYIDYIRRAIGLVVFRDADRSFFTETAYDETSSRVAFGVIERFLEPAARAVSVDLDALKRLMLISVLSGSMGLDMKCSHCAASSLTLDNTIFFEDADPQRDLVEEVHRWLLSKSSPSTVLDPDLFCWDRYAELVLAKDCNLVFFADDLGETIFDLFQLQQQLAFNPGLRVTIIPRAAKFHNDASYDEVEEILARSVFGNLRRWRDEGRVRLCEHGPRNGGIEGPKISARAAEHMLSADVLYIKGSRSYELLATGIRVPTFAAQVVNREFSESVFGVDLKAGLPVLRYMQAFPDFWGFRERHLRNEPLFPTGRHDWQSAMTSLESARFTRSRGFIRLFERSSRECASELVIEYAMRHGVAPHKVEIDLII
jgi:hypothetical protein